MLKKLLILSTLVLTPIAYSATDSFFSWTDVNGVVHFSDKKPHVSAAADGLLKTIEVQSSNAVESTETKAGDNSEMPEIPGLSHLNKRPKQDDMANKEYSKGANKAHSDKAMMPGHEGS